jgi:hypothetical protein
MGWTPPRRPWCARVVVFGGDSEMQLSRRSGGLHLTSASRESHTLKSVGHCQLLAGPKAPTDRDCPDGVLCCCRRVGGGQLDTGAANNRIRRSSRDLECEFQQRYLAAGPLCALKPTASTGRNSTKGNRAPLQRLLSVPAG